MSESKITLPTTYLPELPTGDGQPMAETEVHAQEMTDYLVQVLRDHFASEALIYIGSNNFLYYDPAHVRSCVSPDCYVIKGVEMRLRDSYQVWAENGHLPCVIFELTSTSTWRNDTGSKRDLYQSWGCPDYFIYDVLADKLPRRLMGFHLIDGVYQEIQANERGRLWSEEMQLELSYQDGHLRFFELGEEAPIATRSERAEQERKRAEQEHERAEQERKRAEQEHERAEQERKRAEHAETQRDQERQRADEAEADLRRLSDEIERLRREQK